MPVRIGFTVSGGGSGGARFSTFSSLLLKSEKRFLSAIIEKSAGL
jgi:hypothetical protein